MYAAFLTLRETTKNNPTGDGLNYPAIQEEAQVLTPAPNFPAEVHAGSGQSEPWNNFLSPLDTFGFGGPNIGLSAATPELPSKCPHVTICPARHGAAPAPRPAKGPPLRSRTSERGGALKVVSSMFIVIGVFLAVSTTLALSLASIYGFTAFSVALGEFIVNNKNHKAAAQIGAAGGVVSIAPTLLFWSIPTVVPAWLIRRWRPVESVGQEMDRSVTAFVCAVILFAVLSGAIGHAILLRCGVNLEGIGASCAVRASLVGVILTTCTLIVAYVMVAGSSLSPPLKLYHGIKLCVQWIITGGGAPSIGSCFGTPVGELKIDGDREHLVSVA